jgi:acetylglutamate kinase
VTPLTDPSSDEIVRRFPNLAALRGTSIVIKYGGAAMDDLPAKAMISAEIVALRALGANVVVVHGGGNEINRWLTRLNVTPKFIDGMRVTDSDTLAVSEMVLCGRINGELTARIAMAGGAAAGCNEG